MPGFHLLTHLGDIRIADHIARFLTSKTVEEARDALRDIIMEVEEPTPVEPTPVEPTPVEPTPVEPTPVEPTPAPPEIRQEMDPDPASQEAVAEDEPVARDDTEGTN